MSDTDSSEDDNNLSNMSDTALSNEIELRQFMLTGP